MLDFFALADRRQNGPSLDWRPGPGPGPALWSVDYACGCTRWRHGQPCYTPCGIHEARLGRWSG